MLPETMNLWLILQCWWYSIYASTLILLCSFGFDRCMHHWKHVILWTPMLPSHCSNPVNRMQFRLPRAMQYFHPRHTWLHCLLSCCGYQDCIQTIIDSNRLHLLWAEAATSLFADQMRMCPTYNPSSAVRYSNSYVQLRPSADAVRDLPSTPVSLQHFAQHPSICTLNTSQCLQVSLRGGWKDRLKRVLKIFL